MRRIAWLVATLVGGASIAAAQQTVDRYSIPAKSKYNLQSFAGKRPLTRAERTNFAETSHYDDVVAFIDSLKILGARIVTGSIGKTIEGRELPYVIASRPLVSTPAEARRLNRPIAYVQANIHAGEVEGKEAMQSLLRDLLFDTRKNVLDSIVLIVQPIYNADGNEKWGPQARNRGAQNGPELVGTRQNASGWNLNRDYVDADAPETRGAFAMFNAWNPDLFMDLHTTDGSIHGYDLTYSPPLTPTAVNVIPYATKMLAEIRRRMLNREGFFVNDYGDFSRPGVPRGGRAGGRAAGRGAPVDSAARGRGAAARGGGFGARGPSLEQIIADSVPASGWAFSTYESLARYGTNYYGLRNRLGILSEAFSHDPFARRVASTYDFVNEILSYVAEHRAEIMALGRQGDARVAAWARSPGSSPELSLKSRMDTTRMEDVRVEEVVPLSDSTKREAGMGNRQRTGVIKLVRMPVMASFTPTLTSRLPFAYTFDTVAARVLLPILRVHGIEVQRLDAPASVTMQAFLVDSVIDRGRSETSRMLADVSGRWSAAARKSLPAGSYVVRAGQPRGLAAFYLLEPESEDGLMQWSFYDGIVAAHAAFPVGRVTAPATLRSHVVRD
ncbi:MAG TPA: M14 family zinc carboxypeptidase [Gemmatimonadaceae bacterium]|jgi:zinc carboxypeptidase|nr:M14 family zinc carboxypeptidase [Gemmatimonadaceae bacterium]